MTTLAYEDWWGPPGQPWPGQWDTAGVGAATLAAPHRGRLAVGGSAYAAHRGRLAGMADVADCDVLLPFTPSAAAEWYLTVGTRTPDNAASVNGSFTSAGMFCQVFDLFGPGILFVRVDAGGHVNLTSVQGGTLPPSFTAGVTYWLRFRVTGGQMQARIWADGAPEPAGWQLDHTDPGAYTQPGRVTVAFSTGGGGLAQHMDAGELLVTDDGTPTPPPSLPAAAAVARPRGPVVLFGELRTGRITGALQATGCTWAQTLNEPGSIDQVTVSDAEVSRLGLRYNAQPGRCFLAVELDDVMQEAGPIWVDDYDWRSGQLVLGAAGLWSILDHRKILERAVLTGPFPQYADVTIDGTDLGGIARGIVHNVTVAAGMGYELPIVLEDERPGTRTETFPGFKLYWAGAQLRELTKRETGAPDIAFRPRRDPANRDFLQWVMLTGSEDVPQLFQAGDDWVFDTTARDNPVLGISVRGDATQIGNVAWVTGSGMERDLLVGYTGTGLEPWPLPSLEQEESRHTVEDQATLDGHADQLLGRVSRRVELWKVTVHADAAREVAAGDYARVVTRGHPLLGTGEAFLRVRRKSGDLSDRVTLDMYPAEVPIT